MDLKKLGTLGAAIILVSCSNFSDLGSEKLEPKVLVDKSLVDKSEAFKYHIMDAQNGIKEIKSFGPDVIIEDEKVKPFINLSIDKNVTLINIKDPSKIFIESGSFDINKELKSGETYPVVLPEKSFKAGVYNQKLTGTSKVGKTIYNFSVNMKINVQSKSSQIKTKTEITGFSSKMAGKYNVGNLVSKFNGFNIAEFKDNGTVFTITGKGFKGSTLELSSTNYEVNNLIISDTKISGNIRAKITAKDENITFKVKTPNGEVFNVTKSYIPSFHSREWGQCASWNSKERIRLGLKEPENSAYDGGKSINQDYIPANFDLIYFGTSHQAFIDSVSISTQISKDNRTKNETYTLNLSQFNVDPIFGEALSYYTTYFEVESKIDSKGKVTSKTVKKYPKYSGKSSNADQFFR